MVLVGDGTAPALESARIVAGRSPNAGTAWQSRPETPSGGNDHDRRNCRQFNVGPSICGSQAENAQSL